MNLFGYLAAGMIGLSLGLIGGGGSVLASINEAMSIIDPDEPFIVYCGGGYRSMVFVSTLRARGFHNLVDVKGGYKAIKDSGLFNLSEMATANPL